MRLFEIPHVICRVVLLCSLHCIACTLVAQQATIDRQVTSTSGKSSRNAQMIMTWTMGEAHFTKLSNSQSIFTQGFQQPGCDSLKAVCRDTSVNINSQGFALVTAELIENGSYTQCGIKTLAVNIDSLSCDDQLGDYTVTLTVTDGGNNTSTCEATVTLTDLESVCCDTLIAGCRDTTIFLDSNGQFCIDATFVDSNSYADCGIKSMTVSPSCFSCSDVGRIPVTLTVVNNGDSAASCSSEVVVVDLNPPTANCVNFTAQLDTGGLAVVQPKDIDNSSFDECGLISYAVEPDSFSCSDLGSTHTVTLTVTDSNSNTSTCTASVLLVDQLAPLIFCPPSDTFDCGFNFGCEVTATDNCDGVTYTQILGLSCNSDFPDGTTVLGFQATDAQGLTSSCSFSVTIVGGEPPDTLNPKISNLTAGFENRIPKKAGFGSALTGLGDLNNDGFFDIAIGASASPVVNTRPFKSQNKGDVYIIFLDFNGNVISDTVIGADLGIAGDSIHKKSKFGSGLAGISDLDRDGVEDLVIAEPGLDPKQLGETARHTGGVLVVFLHSDGTVKDWKRIKPGQNGLDAGIPSKNLFGSAVAGIGDIDGDGVDEIAVGAEFEDVHGVKKLSKAGAVYILFMNTDGTVKSTTRVTDGIGGLPEGSLPKKAYFGSSIAPLGDLDGDGVLDLAVGAWGVDGYDVDGKKLSRAGRVYILMLKTDGTVKSHREINYHATKLPLEKKQSFGLAIARIIDTNDDGLDEIAVGSPAVKSPGKAVGSVIHVFLTDSGTLDTSIVLPPPAEVEKQDFYGISIGALNDVCYSVIGVGAQGDNDVEKQSGSVWMSIPILRQATASKSSLPYDTEAGAEPDLIEMTMGGEPGRHSLKAVIFPNPAQNRIHISYVSDTEENIIMSMFDLLGNRLFDRVFDQAEGTEQVDLADLPSGTYFIELRSGNLKNVKKLIVH